MNGDTLARVTSLASPTHDCMAATPIGGGPLWMPVNYMLIESLREVSSVLRGELLGGVPNGAAGSCASLEEVAEGLSQRLTGLFLRDDNGCRPSMAGYSQLEADPLSRDLVLFHEVFSRGNRARVGGVPSDGVECVGGVAAATEGVSCGLGP